MAPYNRPKVLVRSTSRSSTPRRSRPSSQGARPADDLDGHGRDFEARLQVFKDEDQRLTERDEDTLALRLVAEAIGRGDDPAAILATVLERVSVLKNVAYCAFVEPEGARLVVRYEYAAFADGVPTGAEVHAFGHHFDALVGGGDGSREWIMPPEALSIPGGGLVPSSVMLLPSWPNSDPPLLLLAADQRRTAAQLAALLPLLWQVVGIAQARLENLRLVREAAELSAGLKQRLPTVGMEQADGRPQIEVAGPDLLLAGVAIEEIADGVMITDSEFRIQAVNRAFCEITGYDATEVVGRQPSLLQSGRQDPEFDEEMWASMLDSGRWQGEIWNRRKNGTTYPELLSISVVRDGQDQVVNYVGVFSDRSTIKASEERFEFLAQHDLLTGLPNRGLFVARGERALKRARLSGGHVAVMFLSYELDRFKHLSDTPGYAAGDELLRRVAERLDLFVRDDDVVGRLGNDEFMVLLTKLSDASSAGAVAQRVFNALVTPFRFGREELFGTASIGVSLCPEDSNELATLMDQAAVALRCAKQHGRGSLQFYTTELASAAADRFRLESDLRRALQCDEFVLHYQPQLSIGTGEIVGVEALIRWRHPENGLVFPAQFIPFAEDMGLADKIGAWVLGAACRQVRDWMVEGLPAVRVAVNLSAQEISALPLAERIAATLTETGLDPSLLEIEITEGSMMANLETAISTLKAVRALGVTLALDDFGTGYSSLNHLRRFPIDRLKLDSSFIRQIADDTTDQAVASAVIGLGHGLRLGVLAEGVETPAQLEVLRGSGCDAYQGHLFAAALEPVEFAALLRASS